LYAGGAGIDWKGFDRDYCRTKTPLPTYPFEGRRYWIGTSEREGVKSPPIDFGRTGDDGGDGLDDLLYRIEWSKQPIPKAESNRLPSPTAVGRRILPLAGDRVFDCPELLAGMETLSVSYVYEAFKRIKNFAGREPS
jgi:acyl transferase domain-containing protein